MPVNYLHSLLHRVESGWDPISPEYAREYADFASSRIDITLVDHLERQVGGLSGKRVLDLGGGPGQYSVLFAERGADVTWHAPKLWTNFWRFPTIASANCPL